MELESAKEPNTFTTPCFPRVGGVELKKHGVGGVSYFSRVGVDVAEVAK